MIIDLTNEWIERVAEEAARAGRRLELSPEAERLAKQGRELDEALIAASFGNSEEPGQDLGRYRAIALDIAERICDSDPANRTYTAQ